MYLHIGQDMIVLKKQVIGIFDLDTASFKKDTKEFLRKAEKEARMVVVSDDLPKSFVVCRQPYGDTVYISPISSTTLKKRFLSNKIAL